MRVFASGSIHAKGSMRPVISLFIIFFAISFGLLGVRNAYQNGLIGDKNGLEYQSMFEEGETDVTDRSLTAFLQDLHMDGFLVFFSVISIFSIVRRMHQSPRRKRSQLWVAGGGSSMLIVLPVISFINEELSHLSSFFYNAAILALILNSIWILYDLHRPFGHRRVSR